MNGKIYTQRNGEKVYLKINTKDTNAHSWLYYQVVFAKTSLNGLYKVGEMNGARDKYGRYFPHENPLGSEYDIIDLGVGQDYFMLED